MAEQLEDLMQAALIKEGYLQPSRQDKIFAWLTSKMGIGAADNYDDLWMQYLTLKGAPPGDHNDMYYSYLASLGYDHDSINDKQYAWWQARAAA